MVKLTSFIAFSALVIAPTFAAVLPNTIETRDVVAEPTFFGRDMEGLFVREQDFELPDLARRFLSVVEDTSELERRGVEHTHERGPTEKERAPHKPFAKHSMDGLDPELDNHPSIDIKDDDHLFEQSNDGHLDY